jgi:branched-subunit amino acid aminotransferase/4-amino-4-deoxychorismate lyase
MPLLPYEYGHPMFHPMPHPFHAPGAIVPGSQAQNDLHRPFGGELYPAKLAERHDPQRCSDETLEETKSPACPQRMPSWSDSLRSTAKRVANVAGANLSSHVVRPSETPRIAYINGVLLAAEEARVPITDFGFSSGCAIVEEVLLARECIVRLDAHIEKLKSSAAALGLPMPLSTLDLQTACERIVATNQDGPRGALYIQLTFGAYGVRSRHLPLSRAVIPTLVIHSQPLQPLSSALARQGIALFPTPDNRPTLSAHDQTSVPYVSTSQLPELLALRAALANECDEAVLYDPVTDEITGTTQGNIFCVKFGVIYTPPTFGRVPDGVIRRVVVGACTDQGIDVREVSITMPFLSSAAEVFCTSTLDEIVPVRAVGKREIGHDGSVPGPVTSQVMDAVAAERPPSHANNYQTRTLKPGTAPSKRALDEKSDIVLSRKNKNSRI